MEIKNRNILVLSPHSDDMELGCGATIHRLIKASNFVVNMIFSYPPGVAEEEILKEIRAAQVWIEHNQTVHRVFPEVYLNSTPGEDNDFTRCRHLIRQALWDYNRASKPHVVFVPNTKDVHQSHQVVTEEARRVFKHSTILGYELPWNSYGFDGNVFFEVKQPSLVAKEEAIAEYASQGSRDMFHKSFATELARVRGLQAGVPFAECFEAIRIMI